ncbi:MAG: hypothetical protein MK165_17620 [Pirellulaceae bacterium]|nr:hypothetical protein [Pirellulaceae bacterium]
MQRQKVLRSWHAPAKVLNMESDKVTDSENGKEMAMESQVISPVLRRRLQQCYEHGCKLMTDGAYDYDYVHAMFLECVIKDPGNLVYVEVFLENLQRKFGDNKKGAKFKGLGGRGPFKKAVAKGDWEQILQLGPELLKSNPWDVATLRGLANACEQYEFNEVELRYLKNALDANPKDVDVNRHCAHSLARVGQFAQAIACWHRIEELRPRDTEPAEMISELTVERQKFLSGVADDNTPPAARSKQGASPEGQTEVVESSKTAPPSTPPTLAEPMPIEDRRIELTERQKLEQQVARAPEDLDGYTALADLHTTEGRFVEAEQVLAKAFQMAGKNLELQMLLEDATINRARHQLVVAEQRAGIKKTDSSKQLASEFRDNLNRVELQVFDSRCQRFPDNLEFKFELGLRLKRVGNSSEAIKVLRDCRSNRELKALATIEIGECLQKLKQYGKALQYYQRGIEISTEQGRSMEQKLSLYRASVLASALRQAEIATSYLQTLVELDPGYKDAASRLDKLVENRDN